ncbi:hypothetical protein BABINDRAFT_162638 [Babjeviella inositovora NRRL Y-12698]|uniref:tRNA ligase n=1 Tax=Babjeviella inositovora NRRL Y-12698 TaxID=984486 RepID=A0A1E3QL41_9ASCO|nr:uncharacterized protein BABINDRAFT_162638 [Babjeviella inositovora NRRL Y-12698]ODQ78403.1 hypothetical protein BABINDRAFT_162638 [Babjeviella inositovora NRRL Y-12698]
MTFTPLPPRYDTDEALSSLATALMASTQIPQSKGKGKRSTYTVFDTAHQLTGWKFNEFDYNKESIVLPIRARGFFTEENRIAVRGYDKFFNVGEVSTTQLQWLSENTSGPYELTLKENGCIIFISGLADGSIVVCSKHSTGYRPDLERNHALAGQKALEAQLAASGKSVKELALQLHTLNVTAVAELCDDAFEEHVLEYKSEELGLYLHGLNFNTIEFQTYPIDLIAEFAAAWGFIPTKFITKTDFSELFRFLEECAETGSYEGRAVEGFVIRAKAHGADHFWKYKFEEPYLMYRQWREITKGYLQQSKKPLSITLLIKKSHKHKRVSAQYLIFIIPELERDPALRDGFLQGHGIIELRNRFLTHMGQSGIQLANQEGSDADLTAELDRLSIEHARNTGTSDLQIVTKYLIIPVATVGCGKTTTALTLTKLFPWGHIQNDNLSSPAASKLVKGALSLLQTHPAVVVDRNNHMCRERAQLFGDFENFKEQFFPAKEYRSKGQLVEFKYICLNFISGNPHDQDLWSTTEKRVVERGDNHQSIRLSVTGQDQLHMIMKGFINRFQPLNPKRKPDSAFDEVVDLRVGSDSSLENTVTVLNRLAKIFPELVPAVPARAAIEAAFGKSLTYVPEKKKNVKEKREARVQYYAISVPQEVEARVEALLRKQSATNPAGLHFYDSLKKHDRVQNSFHVTLSHVAHCKGKNAAGKVIFDGYKRRFGPAVDAFMKENSEKTFPHNYKFALGYHADIQLRRVVFDGRLMCVEVALVGGYKTGKGKQFQLQCGNACPHITVGTLDNSVKPVMSNMLLTDLMKWEVDNTVEENGKQVQIYEFEDEVLRGCEIVASF